MNYCFNVVFLFHSFLIITFTKMLFALDSIISLKLTRNSTIIFQNRNVSQWENILYRHGTCHRKNRPGHKKCGKVSLSCLPRADIQLRQCTGSTRANRILSYRPGWEMSRRKLRYIRSVASEAWERQRKREKCLSNDCVL